MAVIFDPILGKLRQSDSAGSFLPLSGGTLTGDLEYPDTGFIMMASDSSRWRVTIGTDGAIATSAIIETGLTGQPMGLLLTLTYA